MNENKPPVAASVVFDYDREDPRAQEELFRHANNLLNDFGDKPLAIELVIYGDAIGMLRKSSATYVNEIAQLQERGVVVHACQNAMKRVGMDESELLDNVTSVPSGIGRIVKAQLEGAAYLKA